MSSRLQLICPCGKALTLPDTATNFTCAQCGRRGEVDWAAEKRRLDPPQSSDAFGPLLGWQDGLKELALERKAAKP